MATGLVADADIRGHFSSLIAACRGPVWNELWTQLNVQIVEFRDLGLPDSASDDVVWLTCQARNLVLVTGNRNSAGLNSLEATIRSKGTPSSLPVLTLADPNRIVHDRSYAELVAARLIERLLDIEQTRGSGRLYLP